MPVRTRRRHVTVVGVLMAASVALSAAPSSPAAAAPVFTDDAKIVPNIIMITRSTAGASCGSGSYGFDPDFTSVPVVENAGPATASFTGYIDLTESNITVGRASVAVTARAALSSVGGMPTTIDFGISGSGQLPASPSGGCTHQLRIGTTVTFSLHVPVSGYLTVTTSSQGLASGRVSISPVTGSLGGNDSAGTANAPGTSRSRTFLAAGDYDGSIMGTSVVTSAVPNATGSFTAHGVFTPSGAQTAGVTGKGAKYVALPGAVSCGTGQLAPSVTPKKKPAGKIRDLAFYLGDQLVTKVKHPKKGQVVTLPVVSTAPAELRVVVTLEPKGKGRHKGKAKTRKPKEVTVTAAYEACA